MQLQLPKHLYKRICQLSAAGDSFAKQGAYEDAISKYSEAWTLAPEPKNEWEASTWLLAAIGDACFLSGYLISAIEAFSYALTCPNGSINPFISLRIGQSLYDKNKYTEASQYLCKAYMKV
ncbi:MAG: tetratricopeptide repeat protein [Pseudomonadota bacterium]